ncbi:MAG: glutamate-cysteine ligase family protein [Phycisphaerales bacterium]
MGQTDVHLGDQGEQARTFMKGLLRDLQALRMMLERGMIESGVSRIGAEQEMFLVDKLWRPACVSDAFLELVNDEHFTTELAKFNVEFNADPHTFEGSCLRDMETQITTLLHKAYEAADRMGVHVALVGILPTIEKKDLTTANITDRPRYFALNEALNRLRGGPYDLRITGIDELSITHDSVMLESCNTSFQVHFQVSAEDFASKYNVAQAVTAPVMCASVNSPMLFGKRLWRETRIALFQQSIDTRAQSRDLREFKPRVSFGTSWVKESVLEIFQEDVARFRTLFVDEPGEDPVERVEAGEAPKLSCLRLHNGTVYRWNRACYGISDGGVPHLRIENRVLPSGPTPVDEVANAALWFGLMRGVADMHGDVRTAMNFDDAASNFHESAVRGLEAQLKWFSSGHVPARELLLVECIPLAREGLKACGIDSSDIDRYMGVIEDRVRSMMTGSQWLLESNEALKGEGSIPAGVDERMTCLTSHLIANQTTGKPVAEWDVLTSASIVRDRDHVRTVGQFMTRDLFTVRDTDVIDLAASLMEWRHLRHIPVEDDEHRLVGIVSHRGLLRRLTSRDPRASIPVSEVMIADPVTVSPETRTIDAMRLMRQHRIGALPVVSEGQLVGIITEHDYVEIAAPLLEQYLAEE